MKCPNCQTHIQSGAKFCAYCGTRIESVVNQDNGSRPASRLLIWLNSSPAGIPWLVSGVLVILCLFFLVLWRSESNKLDEAEEYYDLKFREETEVQAMLRKENIKLGTSLDSLNKLLTEQSAISEFYVTGITSRYTLFESRLANILYQGIDNPIRISVPGISADRIEISLTNGSFFKQDNLFFINPKRAGNSIVVVYATIDSSRRELMQKEFRVKPVPDPVPVIANKRGGMIQRALLLAQTGILASLDNFEFDTRFTITEFSVSANDRGFYRSLTSHSNRFTEEQRSFIRSLNRGQMLIFSDIRAVGPDEEERELSPMILRLN